METIEIPRNTYKVECDERVKNAIKWAVSKFGEGYGRLVIETKSEGERDGAEENLRTYYKSSESIANEVARHFVAAGYHAAIYRYCTGYFSYLEISKKPIECGYDGRIIG